MNSRNMTSKLSVILLFHFIGLIYLEKTEDPKTLYESLVTEKEAGETLSKINSNEALPLILHKGFRNKPQLPDTLFSVVTLEGKMIQGIQIRSKIAMDKMFFCPKKTSEENCFVSEHFEKTQYLQCTSEATPIIEYMQNHCGFGEIGQLYETLYKICDGESKQYGLKSNTISFYNICYNKGKQKILFTKHTIKSPQLLASKLLFREREVNYDMRNDFILSTDEQAQKKSTTQNDTIQLAYKKQNFVPAEDMALALWRKTTFQQMNTELQHIKLVDLWNEIAKYIRNKAILYMDTAETTIYTHVFDIDNNLNDNDDQIYNIWVKFVHYKSHAYEHEINEGIAILMNNFIDIESENTTTSNSRSTAIESFYKEDLCADYLKNKFKTIRGHVRCCSISEKILNLFGEKFDTTIEVSSILNVTKDQETLRGTDYTEIQAAYSISEIQQNQVLPLILCSIPPHFDTSSLRLPSIIYHIDTKNRRIVSSSEFMNSHYSETIFFCPKENSDNSCLEPRNFDESKPLECKKEATPAIQKKSNDENRCGADGRGTLHEVIYEICSTKETSRYTTKEIQFFEFCYDAGKDISKILYTHHRIRSPPLLVSKLLFREHSMEYPMVEDKEIFQSNLQELQEAHNSVLSGKNHRTKKSVYKPQKLVPSEDMAFALWRKTTYRYANEELQHEKLIPLWNDINRSIRDYANNRYTEQRGNQNNYAGFSIFTGVFDPKPSSISVRTAGDQKSNIWLKIIYNDDLLYHHAIVILMNNFLVSKTEQSEMKNLKEESLKVYCEVNLCDEILQSKFNNIGGEIRCCPLTNEILGLFGMPNISSDTILYMLNIDGVTNVYGRRRS